MREWLLELAGFAVGAAAVVLAGVSIAIAIACARHGLWLIRQARREWVRAHSRTDWHTRQQERVEERRTPYY